MRRNLLVMAAAVLLFPALAAAQGVCANVTGSATLSPALTAEPNTAAAKFTFKEDAPGTCAGDSVWDGIASQGDFLPGSSCGGNVHTGKTNGGAEFQGVCVGSTCDGGAVLGHAMSYQLVFDAATVQAAAADCPPKDAGGSGKGLGKASFLGSYVSQAKN